MSVAKGILTFTGGEQFNRPAVIHGGTWLIAAGTAWIGYFCAIHDKPNIHNDHEVYAIVYAILATLCPVAAIFHAARFDLKKFPEERYAKTFVDAIIFGVVFATVAMSTQALNVAPIGEGTFVVMISAIFSCLGAGMVVVFHIDSQTSPPGAYQDKVAPAPSSTEAVYLTKG
jgi:hypothetical protein